MNASGAESSVPEERPNTEPAAQSSGERAESTRNPELAQSSESAQQSTSARTPEPARKSESTGSSGSSRAARLDQPWRGAVAAVEVLLAVLLAVAAPRVWQHGIVPLQLGGSARVGDVTRDIGSWLTIAIAMATVAALLVINALRQLMLAVRGAK